MKLTIVQHVPFEIPGLISKWAAKNHHQLTWFSFSTMTSIYQIPVLSRF